MNLQSIGSWEMWLGFTLFVLAMLAIDLGIFHRKAHEVSMKEAATWSVVWIGLALLFNLGIYYAFGTERALEFLTGYLVEKSLSVDNIFVIFVTFSFFAVPAIYQHRVLFWGILGALVMRALFVLVGASLLAKFHWILYVFGGLLLLLGVKLFKSRDQDVDLSGSPFLKLLNKWIPHVNEYHGEKFTVMKDGKRFATPLLIVLILVEVTDLIFAVESIPAIFAITQDPFIVYTSNIFAILGLRSLYFLVSGIVDKFHYLKVGLSFVLIFIGAKIMMTSFYKIPMGVSLGVIATLIGGSIILSLLIPKKNVTSQISSPLP